jgi:hypothetical protein
MRPYPASTGRPPPAARCSSRLSSGRRILTPATTRWPRRARWRSRRPTTWSAQFIKNQDYADGRPGSGRGAADAVPRTLGSVRELAVQAGSTSLTATARKGIATNCGHASTNCSASPTPRTAPATMFRRLHERRWIPFGGSIDAWSPAMRSSIRVTTASARCRYRRAATSRSAIPATTCSAHPSGNGYFVTDYASRQHRNGIVTCRLGDRSGGLERRGNQGRRASTLP